MYSTRGDCLATVKLPDRYAALRVTDEDKVWLYAENSNSDLYNYALLDIATGRIECRFDRFGEDGGYVRRVSPFCGEEGGVIYTAKYFDSRIYALSREGHEAVWDLDMNMERISQNELRTKLPDELSHAYRNREVLHNVSHVFRGGSDVIIAASCFFSQYGLRNCLIKFDPATGGTRFYRIGDEVDREFPFFDITRIVGYGDNTVISAMEAFAAVRMAEGDAPHDASLADVGESDNPILFFHKLKM